VVGSELCDEVRRVLCGVNGERLGDDEECGGKFGDGELLTRALQNEEASEKGGEEKSGKVDNGWSACPLRD
jgi:hypothetical protein